MAKTVKIQQRFALSMSYFDAQGNAAFIDGAPAVASSNEAVLRIVEDETGTWAYCDGVPGTAQITVAADADLTEGENIITGVLDVEVLPGDAVLVNINAGDAEAIPAPAPEPTPEPTPVDPAPVDPAPVDPAPVDPAPVDPAPADPAPVDPAPTDPPVDPTV